ncbi:MAG: hypothetical protein R2744_11690 [Bacteroidales bacterium]
MTSGQVTTACLELSASRDEYLAAKDNLEYNTVSYDAVEEKHRRSGQCNRICRGKASVLLG